MPDRPIGNKHAIPVQRQVTRRKAPHSFSVERVKNKDSNRQIKKCEDCNRVQRQPARARGRTRRGTHEKLHFFSSRSERNSKLTTSTSMHNEIAAPSGQL